MSDLAVNGSALQGLHPKVSIGRPNNGLQGLRPDTQNNLPNVNQRNDQTNINRQTSGRIPAGDELPPIFDEQNEITGQDNQEQPVKDKKDEGTKTGIGMAIGGVGGAIAGGYFFKSPKLGAAIGVAIGGFIGNYLEK